MAEFSMDRLAQESSAQEQGGAKEFGSGGRILKAGDGLMKDAVVTFHSDGKVQFHALVKTEHTHSADIWHLFFILKDVQGNTLSLTDSLGNKISNVPPLLEYKQFGSMFPTFSSDLFDGPGILQGQDYQVWEFTYQYPSSGMRHWNI